MTKGEQARYPGPFCCTEMLAGECPKERAGSKRTRPTYYTQVETAPGL